MKFLASQLLGQYLNFPISYKLISLNLFQLILAYILWI